ncbi:hypothetical protein C8F01DRAFT_1003592 [Mycena amicta]|nr:hypothetical protein C8F01DRAFT_1003592 [Mycena amicta]
MASIELGCAQDANGNLLDADKIDFFNDPDDVTPISGPSALSSTKPLAPIFNLRPVGKVAGSRRRSSRTCKTASRITDPENTVDIFGEKRKANSPPATPPRARRARAAPSQSSDGEAEGDAVCGGCSDTDCEHHVTGGGDDDESPDIDSEYERTKVQADADHEKIHAKTPQEDRTADLKTVYRFFKERPNPTTGVLERGAICLTCEKKGVSLEKAFLKGGVSSLRAHISRHSDHQRPYKERCEALGIPLHPRALSKQQQHPTPSYSQRSERSRGIRTDLLAFKKIDGRHTGETLGSAIVATIDKYELRDKIGWMTGDGASVNRTAIRVVERQLDSEDWQAKDRDMMCVSSTEMEELLSKLKDADEADEGDDDDEAGGDESEEWTSGDALGKLLAFIKQAVDTFINTADDSDEVPPLRNKEYAMYRLSKSDWEKLRILLEVLGEFANVTQSFSSERLPTVYRIIPTLEFLMKRLELMSENARYSEISEPLDEAVKNLQKWYHRVESTSLAYFACMSTSLALLLVSSSLTIQFLTLRSRINTFSLNGALNKCARR